MYCLYKKQKDEKRNKVLRKAGNDAFNDSDAGNLSNDKNGSNEELDAQDVVTEDVVLGVGIVSVQLDREEPGLWGIDDANREITLTRCTYYQKNKYIAKCVKGQSTNHRPLPTRLGTPTVWVSIRTLHRRYTKLYD